MEEDFKVDADPRMQLFIGGFDVDGRPLPINPGSLRRSCNSWPRSDTAPDGVNELLKLSRSLYVHSYFVYEFLALSALVSLQAVEAALRVRLSTPRGNFSRLIDEGAAHGLYEEPARERLHAGRQLRNLFSHPAGLTTWTFGMTSSIVAGSHEIVAAIFP